jgi:hypothetical protein
MAAVAAGAAVAGPRFFWDRSLRLQLPPAERRRRRDELWGVLAGKGPRWARRARRRWRRHARRHWDAETPLASHDLSGGLLLFTRQAFTRVGPFDEAYRLYFEETDWLLRVRRLGFPALYVPAARAVHLYNQSAVREPRAAEWFEASAQRFRRRHYGRWFTSLLSRLDSLPAATGAPQQAWGAPLDLGSLGGRAPLWIEVSPHRLGFPAAAERLSQAGPWSLPAELAGTARFVTATDGRGRELGRWVLPGAEAA